jgi:hypothetical protein
VVRHGYADGRAGYAVGGRVFGEGSAGQRLSEFGGGLLGSSVGARVAGSGPVYGRAQRWAATRNFPGRQSENSGACAVQSCQQIVRASTGRNPSEAEMRATAARVGGYDSERGMTPAGRAAVLQEYGVASHQEPGTPENIERALAEGRGVISSNEYSLLHDPTSRTTDPMGYAPAGSHAVVVTGVERDSTGAVTHYIINDTGSGRSADRIPAAVFRQSLNGQRITVTDRPIW